MVRRALSKSGGWIETIPKRGYRFVDAVKAVSGVGVPAIDVARVHARLGNVDDTLAWLTRAGYLAKLAKAAFSDESAAVDLVSER